jgi:hypothetical protein
MAENDKTYNGWSNYETWCVNLWLSNEEGSYRHCRELAKNAAVAAEDSSQVAERIWTIEEATRFLLADALKELLDELNPIANQASVFNDLITAALSEVDWHEIADAFLEE